MNTNIFVKEVKLALNEHQLNVIKAWAKERNMDEEQMMRLVFEEGYLELRSEEKKKMEEKDEQSN